MANYYLGHTGEELDEAIRKVNSGFKDVSVVTATSRDVAVGKKIVGSDGSIIEGAMPIIDLVTPSFTIDANGVVTVTMNQTEGYVSGGIKTFTYQLPTNSGGEYEAKAQTIAIKGKYMTGDITIVKAEPTFNVTAISGASYGFTLNSSGYYQSGNKGVDYSYAICRVNFDLPEATTVYFDCINYAEANYDYGLIGLVDTALGLNYSADSSVTKNFKGSSSSSVQTVSIAMTEGTHYVDVKYIKDQSQSQNNDTLQFKVRFA